MNNQPRITEQQSLKKPTWADTYHEYMRALSFIVVGAFATEHLPTLLTRTGFKTSLLMTYQDLGLNRITELATYFLGKSA